jgi:hypothetical protein
MSSDIELNYDDLMTQIKSKQKEIKELKDKMSEIYEESRVVNELYQVY